VVSLVTFSSRSILSYRSSPAVFPQAFRSLRVVDLLRVEDVFHSRERPFRANPKEVEVGVVPFKLVNSIVTSINLGSSSPLSFLTFPIFSISLNRTISF
jgi:hypothetical protein